MCKTYIFCLLVFASTITCDLQEGADCKWEGAEGKCVSPTVCLTSLSRRDEKQPECGKDNGEPLICCTDCKFVNNTVNAVVSPSGGLLWKDGRIFRDKCLDYLRDLPHICYQEGFYGGISRQLNAEKKCHNFILWAIGGAPPMGLDPSEHPYEALLGFGKDLESVAWLTSGAIISEKYIVTSASGQSTTEGELPLKFAALGVRNRSDDRSKWQIHMVKKIHKHPQYDGHTRYNDIALVELDTAITFNDDILPACLPDPTGDFDTEVAKASSWKDKGMDAKTTRDTPNITHINKVEGKQCYDQLVSEGRLQDPQVLPKGIISSQTCYGNKDTCVNMSGSPVVVNSQLSRCMNTVVGVSAYGPSCGPTVYTSIADFLPWIQNLVWS